jgi:CYTH domain-containing protein
VRIRIAGDEAFLTIKGPVSGISRAEFEYPIPLEDARHLLKLCEGPIIQKHRFAILHQGHCWEVDEFEGANSGLIVAEIELKNPEETVPHPDWLGKEVTGDPRYYNSNLTNHPYSQWRDDPA